VASRLQTLISIFTDFLSDSHVEIKVARRAQAEIGKVPRITFIAVGGPIVEPDFVGDGRLVATDGTQIRDRIIRVRTFSFLMVIQGQTEEQAETLLHNAIAAWEQAASGSLSFGEEEWLDQAEGADDVTRRGSQVQCVLTIMLPVYATPKPLTFLTGWSDSDLFITQALYGKGAVYGNVYKYNAGEGVDCTGSPLVLEVLTLGGVPLTIAGVELTG
jgi:hypothetical protein